MSLSTESPTNRIIMRFFQEPNAADAAIVIAREYHDQGQLQDAMDSYKRCLTLKPDYADAYNGMGNVYRDQGQLQDAMDSYKRCMTLKPDDADAYNNMGNVYKQQGQLQVQWTVLNVA